MVRKLSLCGMLIAISFLLSNIKIMGSVSFDSLPAFLAGLLMGAGYATIIAIIGHLLSALLAGFPFGLFAHFFIAIMMGIAVCIFALIYQAMLKRYTFMVSAFVAGVAGVLLNGPISVFLLQPLLVPIVGTVGLSFLTFTLTVVSFANITGAIVISYLLKRVWNLS